MWKSVGAIAAGFITIVLLSIVTDLALHAVGIMPFGPLLDSKLAALALGYRTLYSVFGSYLTAKLAPRKPLFHALLGAMIGLVPGIAGALTMGNLGPIWYSWGIVVVSLPAAWLGGSLFIRSQMKG